MMTSEAENKNLAKIPAFQTSKGVRQAQEVTIMESQKIQEKAILLGQISANCKEMISLYHHLCLDRGKILVP